MKFLYVLGYWWCFPNTLLSFIFYVCPMVVAGQITNSKKVGVSSTETIIQWLEPVEGSWLDKRYKYGGQAMGAFVLLNRNLTDKQRKRIMIHEETHVLQQYALGIFQPVVYVLASVFIYIFMPKKHSYYDNPFERQARKRAGQIVNIPPEDWTGGSNDRWLFW